MALEPLVPWNRSFFIVKKNRKIDHKKVKRSIIRKWKVDHIRSKIYDRIEKLIFEDRSSDRDRKSIFDRNHLWNGKVISLSGWILLKLPIISENASNKSCWALNFIQKSQRMLMPISPRSEARGLDRLICFKYYIAQKWTFLFQYIMIFQKYQSFSAPYLQGVVGR